jgi:hypothetical protein
VDLVEYLKAYLSLINKKWILILIITVVLLEVMMYNRNYKTLIEETVNVSPDKGVVQTASLMPKNKTTTDAMPEKKSPISDYFKYFYEGNQEYLKQMSEGRVALSKASQDYTMNLRETTGSDYIDIKPQQFANKLASDLTEFGLSDDAIAGIIGSLAYESLNFTRYKEIKGPGVSAAQYTNMRGIDDTKRKELIRDRDYAGLVKIGARKDAFLAYAQDKGLDVRSYEAFRDFMFYEFRNTGEGSVLNKLDKAKNPEDAARIFTNSFLRPNKDKANMAKRMKNARDFKEG